MAQRGKLGTAPHLVNIKNFMLQYLDSMENNVDSGKHYGIFFTTSVDSFIEIDKAFRRMMYSTLSLDKLFNQPQWFKKALVKKLLAESKLNVTVDKFKELVKLTTSNSSLVSTFEGEIFNLSRPIRPKQWD